MTVNDCVASAAKLLLAAGFAGDDARRDAAVLGRWLLGWDTSRWAAALRDDAPPRLVRELPGLAARRAAHEPVAYITGTREFYGRLFRVTPAVLIPRPETEAIVEEAISGSSSSASPLLVDVGTGSGCIAITLALEMPNARVIGTDVSPDALEVARQNAADLGARNVEVALVSAGLFFPAGLGLVDVIACNPPYIPTPDRASLPADVRDFEPAVALFGGQDGLDVIRALLPAAVRQLAPGARLIMEIGIGQDRAVRGLAAACGLVNVTTRPDLQGIPRVLVAERPRD